MSGEFFCQNTAAGIQVTTKSMVDYSAMQKFLTEKNLHFFTFYTKAGKTIKVVISHLPDNISAEGNTGLPGDRLQCQLCKTEDRQMTTSRRKGNTPSSLSLSS
jgi:hypothetical protein